MVKSRKGSFFWSIEGWFLLGIMAIALWLRLRGIDWPRYHPDEYPIARWIERGAPDRVYPGGLFVLIRPFRYVWEVLAGWQFQVRYFWGHAEYLREPIDYILLGRVFNALLGTGTVALVFAISRIVTGRAAWGLVSAAFLAFSQFHVEHSHYAQTDIPMVFMLSMALWCWVKHIAESRRMWWLLAGLLCGFAAGTKFTLNVLVIPWLIYCALAALQQPRRRWVRVPLWIVGGLFLFALGLFWANPNLTRWNSFMEGLAYERNRVYGETVANMGLLAGDLAIRRMAHLYHLVRAALTLGWEWLALSLLGAPLVLCRPQRRFWVPILLVPALYTYYWIMMSPWVRNQEFLNFVPFLAIFAVMPVHYLWRFHSISFVRPIGLVLLSVALFGTAQRSFRTSSIYGWADTRLLAERWLQRHEPDGLMVGTERYAIVNPRGWRRDVDMVARLGLEAARETGLDLFISQGTLAHRGMDHPITKELYPHYAESYQRFAEGTELLKSWSLLPSRSTRTTFNSIQVELFGLQRGSGRYRWEHTLPQPVWVSELPYETIYPHGRHLGAGVAVEVTEWGRTIGVSSRQGLQEPVYVIVYTRERPADVRVRGFGRSRRVALAPFDVTVLALQRPVWRPRFGHIERISLIAQPIRHVHEIPCYARVAFSLDEVDRILADIQRSPPLTAEAFTALRASYDAVIHADPADIEFQGASAFYYNQFARVHLLNKVDTPNQTSVHLSLLPPPRDAGPHDQYYRNIWETGVKRMAAPMRLAFSLRMTLPNGSIRQESTVRFRETHSYKLLAELDGFEMNEDSQKIELQLSRGHYGPLAIQIESEQPLKIELIDPELTWNFLDVVSYFMDEQTIAMAERSVANGRPGEAINWLGSLDIPPDDPLNLSYRRVLFEAGRAASHPSVEAWAANVLEIAPHHAGALMQRENKGLKAESLSEMKAPPNRVFAPYLRLDDLDWRPAEARAIVTFAVLQDYPPPLVAVSLRQRRRGWRSILKVPIMPDRPIMTGERFEVSLDMGQVNPAPDSVAIAVESSVPWVTGRLRVYGSRAEQIRISEIVEQ
jgi:hypothetical protein